MRHVAQIKASYDWMIRAFDEQVQKRMSKADPHGLEHLDASRDALERGVFILLFGQFEVELTERFEARRDDRITNPDWQQRRGWDVPALGGRRVPFETKLALMIDPKGATYREIIGTYALRNHCAHGGNSLPVGSIDQLVEDLFRWQAELRRG